MAPRFVFSARSTVPFAGVAAGSGGSPTSRTSGLVSVALVSAYLHGPEVDFAGRLGVAVGVGVAVAVDVAAAAALPLPPSLATISLTPPSTTRTPTTDATTTVRRRRRIAAS